jgi:hypothetical protein
MHRDIFDGLRRAPSGDACEIRCRWSCNGIFQGRRFIVLGIHSELS